MYEIIEKNQYGVLVRNTINSNRCINCKYYEDSVLSLPCRICIKNGYYLPDSEAEKLESETSDSQKELIDLRVELRVEKEKSKTLEEYSRGLELKIKELENKNNSSGYVGGCVGDEDNCPSYMKGKKGCEGCEFWE